jgi:hypothetical protein
MTHANASSRRRAALALPFLLFVGACGPDRAVPTRTPTLDAPVTTPTVAPPSTDLPETGALPTDSLPSASFVAGPGGLPLPPDAVQRTDMPGVGGRMSVFEVPRPRDVVGDELRANLATDGWTIDSEELSPRFNALRLKVSKGGATIDARVTGDETKSGIIVTLP